MKYLEIACCSGLSKCNKPHLACDLIVCLELLEAFKEGDEGSGNDPIGFAASVQL